MDSLEVTQYRYPTPQLVREHASPSHRRDSLPGRRFGASCAPGYSSQIRLDDEDAVNRLRAHLATRQPEVRQRRSPAREFVFVQYSVSQGVSGST